MVVTWLAPSHYLKQCWNIVNVTFGNKFQWNLNRNSYMFIHENAFENIIRKLAAILHRHQCVEQRQSLANLTLKGAVCFKYYVNDNVLILKLLYDNGATVDQVRGLILASTHCTYFLHMDCYDIYAGDIYWESYYGPVRWQWEKLGGTFCRQG